METSEQPVNPEAVSTQFDRRIERLVSYAQRKINRKLKRGKYRLLKRDGVILMPIRDYVTPLFYLSEKSKRQNLSGLIYEAEKRVVQSYRDVGWSVHMHMLHVFNIGFQGQYEFRLSREVSL
jgi:hypothetical protein